MPPQCVKNITRPFPQTEIDISVTLQLQVSERPTLHTLQNYLSKYHSEFGIVVLQVCHGLQIEFFRLKRNSLIGYIPSHTVTTLSYDNVFSENENNDVKVINTSYIVNYSNT